MSSEEEDPTKKDPTLTVQPLSDGTSLTASGTKEKQKPKPAIIDTDNQEPSPEKNIPLKPTHDSVDELSWKWIFKTLFGTFISPVVGRSFGHIGTLVKIAAKAGIAKLASNTKWGRTWSEEVKQEIRDWGQSVVRVVKSPKLLSDPLIKPPTQNERELEKQLKEKEEELQKLQKQPDGNDEPPLTPGYNTATNSFSRSNSIKELEPKPGPSKTSSQDEKKLGTP